MNLHLLNTKSCLLLAAIFLMCAGCASVIPKPSASISRMQFHDGQWVVKGYGLVLVQPGNNNDFWLTKSPLPNNGMPLDRLNFRTTCLPLMLSQPTRASQHTTCSSVINLLQTIDVETYQNPHSIKPRLDALCTGDGSSLVGKEKAERAFACNDVLVGNTCYEGKDHVPVRCNLVIGLVMNKNPFNDRLLIDCKDDGCPPMINTGLGGGEEGGIANAGSPRPQFTSGGDD